MNLYLLTIAYGKDIEFKLIDQTAWDYIFSDPPVFKKGKYELLETPPASVVDCIKRSFGSDMEPELEKVKVTSGSWENDRALAMTYFVGEEETHFFSHQELNKFLSEHPEIKIMGEWSGVLY